MLGRLDSGVDLELACIRFALTEGGIELALGINFKMVLKPSLGSGSVSDTGSNAECWGCWTQEWTWN